MNLTYLRYRLLKATRGNIRACRAFGVTIGENCRVLSNIVTTEPWLVTVGDRVTISSDVTIVTHDGSGWLVRDERGRRFRYAPVSIGDDVFVGAGSTLMPGVRVGNQCVVGAGSVVTKSVPDGSVVAGNPARIIGSWTDLSDRILAWPAEADRRGSSYREQVDSIREDGFRPDMTSVRTPPGSPEPTNDPR